MKTKTDITAEALKKTPSNHAMFPPRFAMVAYAREDLLAVLANRTNGKARELTAGVQSAGAESIVNVVREDLLTALDVDWRTHDEQAATAEEQHATDPPAEV